MMNSVKYPSEAENKSREDFLKTIPLPDDVFLAAAKRAVISAGTRKEAEVLNHGPEAVEAGQRMLGTK